MEAVGQNDPRGAAGRAVYCELRRWCIERTRYEGGRRACADPLCRPSMSRTCDGAVGQRKEWEGVSFHVGQQGNRGHIQRRHCLTLSLPYLTHTSRTASHLHPGCVTHLPP